MNQAALRWADHRRLDRKLRRVLPDPVKIVLLQRLSMMHEKVPRVGDHPPAARTSRKFPHPLLQVLEDLPSLQRIDLSGGEAGVGYLPITKTNFAAFRLPRGIQGGKPTGVDNEDSAFLPAVQAVDCQFRMPQAAKIGQFGPNESKCS